MRSLPLLLLVTLSFSCLAGCGDGDGDSDEAVTGPPAGWPSVEERTMHPEHAPTPYTAEQIREHCPSGLRIVLMSEYPGEEPRRSVMQFDGSDEGGTVFSYYEVGSRSSSLRNSREERMSWKALQGETSVPRRLTTVTEDTVTTPLGTYRCMLYTITEEVEKKQADTRLVKDPNKPQPTAPAPGEDPEASGAPEKRTETIQEKLWYAYDLPGPPLLREKTADGELLYGVAQIERRIESADAEGRDPPK